MPWWLIIILGLVGFAAALYCGLTFFLWKKVGRVGHVVFMAGVDAGEVSSFP